MERGAIECVYVPAARGRALARGCVELALGLALAMTVVYFVSDLRLVPSGVSNRIGDYAVLAAMVPVSVAALVLVCRGLKWAALCAWPTDVGFGFTRDKLIIRLGPFGSAQYPAGVVSVRYPFEMSADEAAGSSFEAFLPEDEQLATLVPLITPPDGAPVRLDLLRYTGRSETELAGALAPLLNGWRQSRGGPAG